METTDRTPTNLRDYLTVLRVRKWTVIACVFLVVAAALAYSFTRSPLYTAEARVLVEPITGETTELIPGQPVDIRTQVELVASEAVAALVRDDVGLDQSVESILEGLEATPQGETQVIKIAYTSDSPETAQEVAQSFADSYLELRRDQALEDVVQEEESIETQIQSTSAQLSEAGQDLDAADQRGDQALAASLETQRSILLARLGVLQQRLDDVRAERSRGADAGQVIEPALLPASPSSPNHIRNGILGLVLGLAVGVGLAFLRERLDDRMRDRSDVERVIEAPVLATVPRYPTPGKNDSPLVSISGASVGAVEAYRSLRTNLQFVTGQRNLKSVLVTSPSEAEGKSATTANLGVLLAQAGRRVILVSSDLRRPTLGAYFGLTEGREDEPGLSTWLASNDNEPWGIIKDPGVPNLRIVPSGPLPPNPAELLTGPRWAGLIRLLEENSDFVLCDSPPVLAVADAAELASVVKGCILVVNARTTHKSATAHARQELVRVGASLIGAVLNGHDPSSSPYYYSGYSSYYTSPGVDQNGSGNGTGKKKRRLLTKR